MTAPPPSRRAAAWRVRRRRPARPARARWRRRLGTAARLLAALILVGGALRRVRARRAAAADDQPALPTPRPGGQAALRDQLHHLPRPQRPGRAGPRPEPDRRRLGRGGVPGRHRPDAGWPGQEAPGRAQARRCSPQDAGRASSAPYIQELGGGPQLPDRTTDAARAARTTSPRAASCSGSTARPATRSAAAAARCRPASSRPSLTDATARDIYAAMLTGPQNMPVFGDNQLTPEEKRDIIAYVQNLQTRPATRAAGASAGSARSPRVWPSSWSASWRWSSRRCGLRGSHERTDHGRSPSDAADERVRRRRPALTPVRPRPRGRPARRRGDRPLRAAVPGPRHQGREAGRAHDRAAVHAGRPVRRSRFVVAYIWWPWQYEPGTGASDKLLHAAARPDPRRLAARCSAWRSSPGPRSCCPRRSRSRTATTARRRATSRS